MGKTKGARHNGGGLKPGEKKTEGRRSITSAVSHSGSASAEGAARARFSPGRAGAAAPHQRSVRSRGVPSSARQSEVAWWPGSEDRDRLVIVPALCDRGRRTGGRTTGRRARPVGT